MELHPRENGASPTALVCESCGASFPIDDGVVRMVPRGSPLLQESTSAKDGDELQAKYWQTDAHGFRPPDHPIVRGFAEQRWRYIARHLDVGQVETALDVGCGDGFSTRYAPPHLRITACDGSMTMLRRHTGFRRFQADAFVLPFRDRTFDLVYAWELLHHVSEPHRVLAEMARVSRRYVVSCEPNPLNPAQAAFALYDPAHRWVLRFRRRYMREHFGRAGLAIRHIARGGWVFPNKTPEWMYRTVRRLPYRLPLLGISSVVVAEKI